MSCGFEFEHIDDDSVITCFGNVDDFQCPFFYLYHLALFFIFQLWSFLDVFIVVVSEMEVGFIWMGILGGLAQIFRFGIEGYPTFVGIVVIIFDSAGGMDIFDEISRFDGLDGESHVGETYDGVLLDDCECEFVVKNFGVEFLFI